LRSWLAAEDTSASKKVERQERLVRMAETLASLADDQRVALELRHLRGLTVAEVARAMGRSPAAVAACLIGG
jgi:RNA polymerase sigma factor (sigma-70 family)